MAEGVPSALARREVGVNPCTGRRWRNGRRLASGGRVLDVAPAIAPRHPSPSPIATMLALARLLTVDPRSDSLLEGSLEPVLSSQRDCDAATVAEAT
jgi:hypothetical protein